MQRQCDLVALGREATDFEFPERFEAVIDKHRADIIINVATYTDVDGAEDNEELATKINGVAPFILAEKAAARNIPFLRISTDYVFDGRGDRPWSPSDQPKPLNARGGSKFEGENRDHPSGWKIRYIENIVDLFVHWQKFCAIQTSNKCFPRRSQSCVGSDRRSDCSIRCGRSFAAYGECVQ